MMHDEAEALDEHFGALDDQFVEDENLLEGEEDDENLDDEDVYLSDDAGGLGFEAAPDADMAEPDAGPTPFQVNGTVSTYSTSAEVGESVGLARVSAEVRGLRQAVAAADESVTATNRTAAPDH